MADIPLQLLADRLPVGSFTETVDDVTISLKALLKEPEVQLESQLVTELNAKVLLASFNAQTDYNADPANAQDITTFSAPFTASTQTVDGQLVIPISSSISYLAPVGLDSAQPTTI